MTFEYQYTFLRSSLARDPFALGDLLGPEDVLRIEAEFPTLFSPSAYISKEPSKYSAVSQPKIRPIFQYVRPIPRNNNNLTKSTTTPKPIAIPSKKMLSSGQKKSNVMQKASSELSKCNDTAPKSPCTTNANPKAVKPLENAKLESIKKRVFEIMASHKGKADSSAIKYSKSSDLKPSQLALLKEAAANLFAANNARQKFKPIAKGTVGGVASEECKSGNTNSKSNTENNAKSAQITKNMKSMPLIKINESKATNFNENTASTKKFLVKCQNQHQMFKPGIIHKKIKQDSVKSKPTIPERESPYLIKSGKKKVLRNSSSTVVIPFTETHEYNAKKPLSEINAGTGIHANEAVNSQPLEEVETDEETKELFFHGCGKKDVEDENAATPIFIPKTSVDVSSHLRIAKSTATSLSTKKNANILETIAKELIYAEIIKHLNEIQEQEANVNLESDNVNLTPEASESKSPTKSGKSNNICIGRLSAIQEQSELDVSTPTLSKTSTTPRNNQQSTKDELLDIILTPDTPELSSSMNLKYDCFAVKDSPGVFNKDATDCSEMSDFVLSISEIDVSKSNQKHLKEHSPIVLNTPFLSNTGSSASKSPKISPEFEEIQGKTKTSSSFSSSSPSSKNVSTAKSKPKSPQSCKSCGRKNIMTSEKSSSPRSVQFNNLTPDSKNERKSSELSSQRSKSQSICILSEGEFIGEVCKSPGEVSQRDAVDQSRFLFGKCQSDRTMGRSSMNGHLISETNSQSCQNELSYQENEYGISVGEYL